MYELLGPHVNQTYGGIPELIARWKPAVALILDHNPVWHWVKGQSPDTIMVGRYLHPEPPDYERINPEQHARDQLAPILGAIANSPYDYIVGDNEVVVHSAKAMSNLARYDIERMKILARVGKKAAICGLATGNPSDMSMLEHYLPAMEAAVKYGAVLHLHQYDWPTIGANGKWLPYRHELFYDGCPEHGWAGVPNHLKIPIIITEFGLDQGAVENGILGSWRSLQLSPRAYMDELERGQRRLMQSPWVIGACIFCVGNASGKWVFFDFWPEIAGVIHGATPLYRRPAPVEDDGIIGIDVSYAQPKNFPWKAAVENDGLDFAIIRASARTFQDRNLSTHWAWSGAAGVKRRGIYHYLYPGEVRAQARHFAAIAADHPCDVILYPDGTRGGYFLDVEQYGVTKDMVRKFKEEFEAVSGLHMDYYTSAYKWSKLLGKAHRDSFNQISWIADWRNVQRFAVPWGHRRKGVKIRQVTSDNGRIHSYKGRLDINEWLADPAEFV